MPVMPFKAGLLFGSARVQVPLHHPASAALTESRLMKGGNWHEPGGVSGPKYLGFMGD